MNKSELLNWLQEQNKQWQALLEEIGPERMDQPGVNGEWSMKDIVAHLTGWNRRLVANLQAALRGEPEPAPPWPERLQDEDEINGWIYETNRQRSVDDVLAESHQQLQEIQTIVEGLPSDVRLERVEPAYYLVWLGDKRFLVGEFFDHFRDDHEPDVHAWLAQVENGGLA